MAFLKALLACAVFIVVVFCWADPPRVWARPAEAGEYQVKAAFLFHFLSFVEWPQEEIGSATRPARLAVLGADPFGDLLESAAASSRVKDRYVSIDRISSLEELGACHLLFVSRSMSGQWENIAESLRNRPILVVSDMDSFCERGGMIQLRVKDEKVNVVINPKAIHSSGLQINAHLLRVAEVVGETKKNKAGKPR